jgi:hypothetical protein
MVEIKIEHDTDYEILITIISDYYNYVSIFGIQLILLFYFFSIHPISLYLLVPTSCKLRIVNHLS